MYLPKNTWIDTVMFAHKIKVVNIKYILVLKDIVNFVTFKV